MSTWGGVAMLASTGVGIFLAWLWIWAGFDRYSRALTLERVYPFAPGAAIPNVQKIMWPVLPLLACAWLVTAQVVAQSIIGRDAMTEMFLLAIIFTAIALVPLWLLFGGNAPACVYPGWRAQRFYLAHPHRVFAELPTRNAHEFCRVYRLPIPVASAENS